MSKLPLSGVKVIEMGRMYAAPLTSQMLADFGADVIKIENPLKGDQMRGLGPGFIPDAEGKPSTDSGKFSSVNRNKKSVTINLADQKGAEIAVRLLADADVLIENYKVGDLARYGLDYSSVCKFNPGIIYASITGFGQTGPYSSVATLDAMIQAYSGFMSVNGEAGGPPLKSNVNIMDFTTGLFGAFATMMALYNRADEGKGCHIDLSMMDCGVSMMSFMMLASLAHGEQLPRTGSSNFGWVPSGVFTCLGGSIFLASGSDQDFEKLCRIIGRPEMLKNEKFASRELRETHRDAVSEITEQALGEQSVLYWVNAFNEEGMMAAPIYDFADIPDDPQVIARKLMTTASRQSGAEVLQVRNPIVIDDLGELPMEPPPLLGENTQSVLRDALGYSEEEILSLREDGVISTG